MPGPLAGVRVIDFSAVVAGPFSAMWLAEQGADVVKVEATGLGDITRGRFGPEHHGLAGLFVNCNRGKRSISLDVSTPEGHEIVRALVKTADVFVQNWRPGVVDRLGLAYEDLRADNPQLIYVSVSGFGPDGPYAQRRVYDPIIQALSGHVAAQLNPVDGLRDLVRTIVCDKATGLVAAQAMTAALFARERGAAGQHIEVPMLDTAIAFAFPDAWMRDAMLDCEFAPNSTTLAEVYSLTKTADGYLVYYCASDQEIHGVFRGLGHPEWCTDERFATLPQRRTNRELLGGLLEIEFSLCLTEEIYARLLAEDVPVGMVLDFDDVPNDPQVLHNEIFRVTEQPGVGRVREPRHPARFGATPVGWTRFAPRLGADTEAVLAEIGYEPSRIDDLAARKVIQR